ATLGKVTNPFVLTAQIETSWVAFLLVLVFLCVDDWTINVLNLYSGGLSLSNMFERLGRFWTTLIASVFGVALCGVPDVLNFFRYVTLFGERVFAGRRRACVRLPVRAAHADRRPGALRPERPLPLLGWLQSHRRCLDGDRLSDLHLRDPDRMDPSLAEAADHGCRLPADRLDRATRQVRDLASTLAQRPARVVEMIHTADADSSELPQLRRSSDREKKHAVAVLAWRDGHVCGARGEWGCMGAELSRPAGAHAHCVSGRRYHRHARAHPRAEAHRSVGAERRHRESS